MKVGIGRNESLTYHKKRKKCHIRSYVTNARKNLWVSLVFFMAMHTVTNVTVKRQRQREYLGHQGIRW